MPWPVLGAILLKPSVIAALVREPELGDAAAFRALAERTVLPAVEVCRALAVDRGAAA